MTKFERDRWHSTIKCHIIDILINEIFEDEEEFEDLPYFKKLSIIKLVKKKTYLYGKIEA